MPSKYPCCSDCGTKLKFVFSNIKAPNEHRVRFYSCTKCNVHIVRVKKQIKIDNLLDYNTFVAEFIFDNLAWKK